MATITTEIKNAIINEMEEVLSSRYYSFGRKHLEKIVNEWFERKKGLIELLSKHPLWNPDKFLIQFDVDMERGICTDEIYRFTDWLMRAANISYDYWTLEQTREYKIYHFIRNRVHNQFFDESMSYDITKINELNDNFKLRTNMKSSKAIGKICREENWDKLEGYNQRYAALCDCLNPLKVKRHTVISLNPLDYLLMSNGNSWNSCHDIGQSGDCGCYSSGTISYMLDEHSFIFYTVDASYDGNRIELEPKIQRQVFGYNDEVIVQSRLYPQSNDSGAKAVYDDIRAIVQKVISDCLEKPNMWIKSTNAIRSVVQHGTGATCYPDWVHQGELCSVSTHKEREDGKELRKIVFGAEPICITCGYRHEENECISCCDNGNYYTCEDCGERIHEDDVYWVGVSPYCTECVTYCEDCNEYVRNEDAVEIDGVYVCNWCVEHSDYYECSECGDIHHIDCLNGIGDELLCEDCYAEKTSICDKCFEHYYNEELTYDKETDCYYCPDCYEIFLKEKELVTA